MWFIHLFEIALLSGLMGLCLMPIIENFKKNIKEDIKADIIRELSCHL